MKAALLTGFQQALEIADVPDPQPAAGQVRLRVEACGVCHSDLHLAQGEWPGFKSRMPMPLILGHEVAGVVDRVGPGVTEIREGDRVGMPWFHSTCGSCDYCHRGMEVFCERSEITGVTVHGGFAQYSIGWASHVVPIPAAVSMNQAAPLFCAGGTVFSALNKVEIDGSTRLGVWGAGGLGQYAIQISRLRGATVTAVDPSAVRREAARRCGAADAVDPALDAAGFERAVKGVDIAIVTAASAAAVRQAFLSLRKAGELLIVGIPGEPLTWTAGELIRSGVRIIPSRVCSRAELRDLLGIAADGHLHADVESVPLDGVNLALTALETGTRPGRTVLAPWTAASGSPL